jgi:hypothetical protein
VALLLLILFAFVPYAAWRYVRSRHPSHVWLVTGVAFGAVVSPLSTGLYATFFLGPFGLPTGIVGLLSALFHGTPGYDLALWLGLVQAGHVVSGFLENLLVELLNAIVWAVAYGLLGALIDWSRSHPKLPRSVGNAP